MTDAAIPTQNPGSAIGEAIGALMEAAINEFLAPLAQDQNARLLTKGPVSAKTGRPTKLIMYDDFATKYSIDGVIVNEENQPLILLESKYIRYTKHNRDKGSWVCHAHGKIRLRYSSVRSSIAVLAGNWSATSLKMMSTNNINLFVIPFDHIVTILAPRGIDFNWGEKDRHLAVIAWNKYSAISEEEQGRIGRQMIEPIKSSLAQLVESTLRDDVPRAIAKVVVEIYSNLGETKRFKFDSREAALSFLEDFTLTEMLDHSSSYTIFDLPVPDPTDDAD